MADDPKRKSNHKGKNNGQSGRKISYKWVITIIIWTFIISATLQMIQSGLMSKVTLVIAFIMLLSFIIIGIIFDIIGVASTAASEAPFHSLSSRKMRGAKEAVLLIRNADKVSNFCNDVIGDIVGVISGSATSAIVLMMASSPRSDFILNVVLAALVASITVGGKAFGKFIALSKSNNIIFTVGKIISIIKPVK